MTDPIIHCQETLAYQAEEIRHLSDELYRQQKEIRTLQVQMTQLQALLESRPEPTESNPFDREPPPPHY